MSFLYPRVVALRRPGGQSGEGIVAYGGQTQAAEQVIAWGIPASIQERREGQASRVGLPGDGTRPSWYVFIPRAALPPGSVLDRDVIVDDQGQRYQVIANYWDSLGHRLTVERLEA
jgi:hypothetical protein